MEANERGWLGEVQGLQISLDAARAKMAALDRINRASNGGPVQLGMPVIYGDPRS